MEEHPDKIPARSGISRIVRDLRTERGWTQADLAAKLGLSQSRLSEIERGGGSFTAEQFLLILKLFNVTTSRFTGEAVDRAQQVQNALARQGASHLRESSDVAPSDDLADPLNAAREALLTGDTRLIAALAAVFIENAGGIGLVRLYWDLQRIGLERRLLWVCENIKDAADPESLKGAPRPWILRARRSLVVLESFVESLSRSPELARSSNYPPDVLDTNIRSKKTLEEIRVASSSISKRWGIVSSLQPRDFAQALRDAIAARS